MPDARALLRPAAEVDPIETAEGFFSEDGPTWRFDDPRHLEATMIDRATDAVGPSLLAIARRVAGGPIAVEGITVARKDMGDPWVIGLLLEEKGAPGMLVAVDLRVPLTASRAARREIDTKTKYARMKGAEAGLSGQELEAFVIAKTLFTEDDLLEGYRKRGYPDDLPIPDEIDDITRVSLYRFSAPTHHTATAAILDDLDAFAAYAASLRNHTDPTLDEVVTAHLDDGYTEGLLLRSSPAYSFADEEWTSGHLDLRVPFSGREFFRRLRPVAEATGEMPAITERAQRIGRRRYFTPVAEGWGRSLQDLGAAAALMDDGLPGERAISTVRSVEIASAARALPERMSSLGSVILDAEDHGHIDEESSFKFNDMNNSIHVERIAGRCLVTVTDQNGRFLLLADQDADGKVTTLSAARFGHPIAAYAEDRWGNPADPRRLASREFFRDYANPMDPQAPLPRDRAASDLLDNRCDFPGFLGTYELRGGRIVVLYEPRLDLRVVKDLNNIKACIESAAICLREEYRSDVPTP